MIKYLEAKNNKELISQFIKDFDDLFGIEWQVAQNMHFNNFPQPSVRQQQVHSQADRDSNYPT